MPLDRDPATLLDIATAARRVLAFTAGYSAQQFFDDEKTQSAVLHQLLIIGEAAKRLSPQTCDAIGTVPWRDMARMRDRLIHHYETIQLSTVWEVVERHVPALLDAIEPHLPTPPENG